jgi:hypothetical protein
MELTEKIETINNQLIDMYGIDTVSGQPMWKVVWSEEQFEHRLGTYVDYTTEGLYIRTVTEVRYVKMYPWIVDKYVLVRLVAVSEINAGDLPAKKTSYEPMYPFMTPSMAYAPPSITVCKFVITGILAAQGKDTFAKYLDKEAGMSKEEWYEMKNKELQALQDELFGNETETGDAIAHGEAVIVPRNYEKNTSN